ncbi:MULTISPECIES: glutathione S-transferase N-terminal domain-containing protein [unclassified Bradyrhizobium]|uniref:glutathione S-transferase N-terminal domain-containing protein n=1 Tax=unclassified Bradyrhizobium TaxID=2631580 RepID=UPI002916A8C8|nr:MULTISPECIES: glutathione S-transferase N-terminal domain-containing protein [unclassified Bradyrhizobium]
MHTLYYAATSPYSRKIRVLVAEKGLSCAVELVLCAPFDRPADLVALNPLSKVPTLVTDDSQVLIDSPVIAEYLDRLAAPRLIPSEGRSRWDALRRQALADGIIDAGVSMLGEHPRDWMERKTAVIIRALDAFEAEIDTFEESMTIGHIALGCALGRLDFRMAALDWRAGRTKLARWNEDFQARPSMQATRPV